jgi:hypothetical protein
MNKLEPYLYTDISEVPYVWKFLKGARLSLDQINSIITDAYDNQIASGDSYIPDYGGAKKRFQESHVINTDFWSKVEE